MFSLSIVTRSTVAANAATQRASFKIDGDHGRSLLRAIAGLSRANNVNAEPLARFRKHQRQLPRAENPDAWSMSRSLAWVRLLQH